MGFRMKVRRPQLIAVAVLVLASAATGCSEPPSSAKVDPESTTKQADYTSTAQTSASTSGEPTSTVAASAPDAPAPEVPAALAFRAPLVGGGEFDGASYAGRPVAFWFWAPT